MVSLKGVLKLAQTFHNRAIFAQQEQSQQYANAIIQKMIGLANGGAAATNHLLSIDKYRHSTGLSALKQKFPEVAQRLGSFNHAATEASIQAIGTMLDGMNFYTGKGNAGTGYDPITSVSDGGYTAPSYYVENLLLLTEKLKTALQHEPHSPWQPTDKDPIAKDLTRVQNAPVKRV
jgi:hypothetical protein